MARHRTLAATLALLIALGTAGCGPYRFGSPQPRYSASGFAPQQRVLIDSAIRLFDQAALPLPPVDLFDHDGRDGCRGRDGWHRKRGNRSLIDICTEDVGAAAQALFVHELAHAWDAHFLDDARRAAFLELRALTMWRGDDQALGHEYRAEHAAEFVVWALMDRPIWTVHLPRKTCDDLRAGYLTLTGAPPPHRSTGCAWCELVPR